MTIRKYDSFGDVLESCGEWRVAGTGARSLSYQTPHVYLMGQIYTFDASQDNFDGFGVASSSTPGAIGYRAVARAPLANPRIDGRQLKADVTLVANVPIDQTVAADALTHIEHVIIAMDILLPDESAYVQRPIFYYDELESAQMPYLIDGYAISVSFPSNIVYTF